jgi:hypothetical protein
LILCNHLFFILAINLILIILHLLFEFIFINIVRCFRKHIWFLKIVFLVIKRWLGKLFLKIFIHVFSSVYRINYMHMVYSFRFTPIKRVRQYIVFIKLSIIFTAFCTFTQVMILWILRIFWSVTFCSLFNFINIRWIFFLYFWWGFISETATSIICWNRRYF